MYHIATHNIGLGSYNDDFNRLMKDLLMKDHFGKGFCDTRGFNHQKLFKAKARLSAIRRQL